MSVRTDADDYLESAKTNLNSAYQNLLQFLNEDCWGNSEYDDEYKEKIHEITVELFKLKNKIK